MKATGGNLRLDQSYTLEGQDYHGKFADNLSGESCQNCGLLITNIGIVRGSVDNTLYRIGLDCAATLTGIEPSAIAQAKKVMARRAACLKWIKTQCKMGILSDDGKYIALYDYEPMDWRPNRKYDVTVEKYGETLTAAGIPIKTPAQLRAEMMAWIVANCAKAEVSGEYVAIYDGEQAAKKYGSWSLHKPVAPDIMEAIALAGVEPVAANY